MQYLTYEEYKEIGGTLDLAAFNRNIDRACGFLRNETGGRIDQMRYTPDPVKPCVRDLLEHFAGNAENGRVVSSRSQSAGGVSESESYQVKDASVVMDEAKNIAYDYMACVRDDYYTPLLYRGAMR